MGEFKYFGVIVSEKGGLEVVVKLKMSVVRVKWKEYIVIIYDKRMVRKLKVKVYSYLFCIVVWMWGVDIEGKWEVYFGNYRDENVEEN